MQSSYVAMYHFYVNIGKSSAFYLFLTREKIWEIKLILEKRHRMSSMVAHRREQCCVSALAFISIKLYDDSYDILVLIMLLSAISNFSS